MPLSKVYLLWLVDRNSKNNFLEELIDKHPSSSFIDDAYFELANTYTVIGLPEKAIKTYEELVIAPSKSFCQERYWANGLILYNQEKLVDAQDLLRNLIINSPKDGIAKQALGTLKEISIDLDSVSEFTRWLEKYEIDAYTDNELKTALQLQRSSFYQIEKTGKILSILFRFIPKRV